MRIICKNLNIVLFLAAMLSFNFSYAQLKTITGKVTDADNGEPLPGVTIVVKGTTQGTITDFDGNYTINVDEGETLLFSFVGYTPQEIVVTSSMQQNIALAQSTENLDEVVVIGYGQVKKSDATGSVTSVSSDDFNKGNITSPQDLLVGKASGVVVTTSNGAPGSGSTIRIRGGSSLNASNDPLIIVDGVPISNDDVSGSNNILAFVNPNDIESMNVLKDASATAIYGSRASNGVIIITTKKGKRGKKLQISADIKTSIASPIEYVDVYSGDEMRQIAYSHPELYDVNDYDALWDSNTDWQDEIFRTSVSQDHNISVSGAIKNLPYRVSVGYTDQNGILENTYMKRVTGSISLNPVLFEGKLKVNLNAKGMHTKNNFGESGAIGNAINMDPTKPIYDDSPSALADWGGYFQWSNYGASLGTVNPVEQAMAADNKADVNRIIANAQFDYMIFNGLRANLNLATDYFESDGHNNRPITSPTQITDGRYGKLNTYDQTRKNNLLEFYLNYKKDIEAIKSTLDVTAGYSWQHFDSENSSYTKSVDESDLKDPVSTYNITENYLVSFFGRVNYTLADKYLLTGTVRYDGSSRFAEDNRWGLFPSAAFAWKIKNENFLKDVDAISSLKLRLGWGVTGQQDIGSDYPAQSTYVYASTGSYYMVNGKYVSTLRPDTYDPDIKWEETTTQNIGLDFGFMDDRLTGSIDVYKRETKDLLNEVTIPTGCNFSNTLLTNVGSLENKGVEVALEWKAISKKDMSLSIGANLTYNKNEITKLLFSDDPDYIGILYGSGMTGKIQVTRVGESAYSFFLNKQVYYPDGKPIEGMYEDLSGEGGAVNGDNEDKYICHDPAADILMGLSLRFNYKNFDFSASSRMSLGNYVYNQIAAGASYDQISQIGYWKNMPKSLDKTQFVTRQFTSDYFCEDASFFKLDNVSLGYTFNNISDKLKPRINFTVQNVFTITDYSGLDPEVPVSEVAGVKNIPGIDTNFYPRARTFMIGIGFTY